MRAAARDRVFAADRNRDRPPGCRPRHETSAPRLSDRHPDFYRPGPCHRVEVLVVALEAWAVGDVDAGRRQPLVPDRVVGAPEHRYVCGMTEDRVALSADADR